MFRVFPFDFLSIEKGILFTENRRKVSVWRPIPPLLVNSPDRPLGSLGVLMKSVAD